VTGLDASHRAELERLIVRARSILEQDLEGQAEGRYGINSDGTIEDEEALHLDSSALADRREIVAIVEHLRDEGETTTGAVARLIREAAFTHLNRLVAIRVAEAMGLVPPSLAEGRASLGFREVVEVAPLLAGDETGGYWTYLRLCGDEMSGDAPVLFDPRNPLLTLSPSVAALDGLVTLFSDPAAQEVWMASDTFGWAYQFFNTGDERRQMRDESAAPRNSRELAVRNQFFTPRYVVDFLVQNTLGRRLLEAQLDSALIDALPLLVDPPTEAGEPLPLDEVRILDPACGSGHFLLGCYDLLERAWQLQGVAPADAAPLIVPTLWGIDIDPRCAQVASAAIVFRARRHCRSLPLPRPNIITARALPDASDSWGQVLASLPSDRRDLVSRMREALLQAPVLGPLLRVEERLAAEIRRHFTGSEIGDGTLAEGIAPDAFGGVESEVLDALQRAADSASSSPAERLLAAEASDAMRFVDATRQRYDVVLMNPPFGDPVPDTKAYLRAAYPWIPTRDYNLLAAFVGRGIELCKQGGYLGAITSRVGMFLITFEEWRRKIVLSNRLVTLADLGYGVMEQALVEAAAYVIQAKPALEGDDATFIGLLKDADRSAALPEAIAQDRRGLSRRVFRVSLLDFAVIPGSPVAYWIAPSVRKLFADFPALEGSGGDVRVGMQTGDDFRFVRTFWEVDPRSIARSREETTSGRRWVPFAKGGEYSPFWSDVHLLVNYLDDGRELRESDGAVIRSPQYYFRPGVTWPRRTASGIGVRALPAGVIFADQGPSAFPRGFLPVRLLAWMALRLTQAILDAMLAAGDETTSGGAARAYQVGRVQSLPWPGSRIDLSSWADIEELAFRLVERRAVADETDETSRRFVRPGILEFSGSLRDRVASLVSIQDDRHLEMIEASEILERAFRARLQLDDAAEAFLNEEVGPHPGTYQDDQLPDDDRFVSWYKTPIDQLIDEVVAARGGSRAITNLTYVADRRLEVLAHALECHPRLLAETRASMNLLPPDEPKQSAGDLFSYLVGLVFGRWDMRIARDPALAPGAPELFAPQPICCPGMLVDQENAPAREEPSGYPFALPPGRLLLDEPGHDWDIEDAVRAAAAMLFDDSESLLGEMVAILGRRSVRDYLRRQFFKDHLSRYSRSRRKAPIYWPLMVPSRSWGVWTYAAALSRETLFAIAGAAARREALAAEAIRRLQAERDTGGAGRSVRQVSEALAAEEALTEELGKFRTEAERIAGLGWEPDLDDGIILCAAPLAGLFPAWPDAAKEREQILKGRYPWATVSGWKDVL
jgi:hypothetical protein